MLLNSNLRKRNCPVLYSNVAPSSVYSCPLALPWLGKGRAEEEGERGREGKGK